MKKCKSLKHFSVAQEKSQNTTDELYILQPEAKVNCKVNRRNVSHAACFKFGKFFCKRHSSTTIIESYNAFFIVEQLIVWAGKIAKHNMC